MRKPKICARHFTKKFNTIQNLIRDIKSDALIKVIMQHSIIAMVSAIHIILILNVPNQFGV